MKKAAEWSMGATLANTVCLFTDGRTAKLRRLFEEVAEKHQIDESRHYDGQITYYCPPVSDPRFASRKVFAGLCNREALVGSLPVPRTRMISKPRTHYSGCGEKSTYAATYSKAHVRPWKSLPRMTLADKEKMVGVDIPVYAGPLFETLRSGHPLFMLEVKEVEMYLAIFEDMNITHIFDLAAGSGAAAMAAAILKIHYEGFAMNQDHATWLDCILDKAMFAVVVDASDEESMQIKADVSQYFNNIIEEARKLLDGHDSDEDGDDGDEDGGGDGEQA